MRKKMIWGFGALILIIGLVGVSAVLLMRNTDTEPKRVYRGDVEPSQKPVKRVDKEQTTKPNGHYHSDGTWQEGTHAEHANVPENPTPRTVPEIVIYPHQKLLDTHPVAALRAQARDRGHWSAKYIPPFPPDDVGANELARALYIYIDHFDIKGFTDDDPETKMPAIRAARKIIRDNFLARNKARGKFAETGQMPDARHYDLWKLNWADRDSLPKAADRLDLIPSNFNNQGGSQ